MLIWIKGDEGGGSLKKGLNSKLKYKYMDYWKNNYSS